MSETPKFCGAADDKTPSGSSSAKSRVEVVTDKSDGQWATHAR